MIPIGFFRFGQIDIIPTSILLQEEMSMLFCSISGDGNSEVLISFSLLFPPEFSSSFHFPISQRKSTFSYDFNNKAMMSASGKYKGILPFENSKNLFDERRINWRRLGLVSLCPLQERFHQWHMWLWCLGNHRLVNKHQRR